MNREQKPKARVSRKRCAICGERIRGIVYRLNKRTLCDDCVETEIRTIRRWGE